MESQNRLFKRLASSIVRRLPKNRVGDKLSSFIIFWVHQGRRPRRSGHSLNDLVYSIKSSDEICSPLRGFVSDKEFSKMYVASKIGDKYNVPTVCILKSKREVDDYEFPADVIVKPTHMSGAYIFSQANCQIDKSKVKSWFDVNYYNWTREYNYKHLKPKVIVEPVLFSGSACDDYKVFCLAGEPRFIKVDLSRHAGHRSIIYDIYWKKIPVMFSTSGVRAYEGDVEKPKNLDDIIAISKKLSEDFSFCRIDCYTDGDSLYVGEITNTPGDTRSVFETEEQERLLSRVLFS